MKKSISIWSFPESWPLEKKMRLARESGFDGFEIDLSEGGPVSLSSTPQELLETRKLAEKLELTLSGLATGLYWGANPASEDRATREKAEAILTRQIECAAMLGIDAILVVPASVGVDFIPGAEVVPYDVAWDRAQAFVRQGTALAEKRQVKICIENVWNKFLTSPLEMKAFIDAAESEWVASYLDIGNVLAFGYPEQWIRILGSRIRRVHFKDYRRNVGSIDGFCDLLSGDVNWPSVTAALKDIGYDGWCTAEMIPPVPFYKHAPEILIENTSRAMSAIFNL